ncbi:BadF/BadG/BcrA/BcrD ATPase family protein [Roseivivax isoporae]|uniref:ATPase n=1 Tax=Roseivivax isoporae LMG 25204 TaxID=1449351 RepID=X7F5G8_9RHOB|nr:BadF/BadG/BcrA/BcrD ATPase family protein [Roseivivax isoporae]ETX27351.1 ATPase [Roseivivax isoporae LMG 25204]
MDDSRHIPVIGIDGGGTRCRVALDDGRGRHVVETGSANASTDLAGTVRQVAEGLAALGQAAGWAVDDLVRLPAFVGLAGVTGPAIAEALRAALPLVHARIDDDRPAALRGVLGRRDGALAHCGTGSFFALQAGGGMRIVGGWGSVLGDEASAQWIGRRALAGALDRADGLAAPSPLSDALLSEFGGTAGIVAFAATATPAAFGALAPRVTDRAGQGDALARAVMQAGARHVAETLATLGWTPGRALCLTGGIGPHFAPFLPADMEAAIVPPEGQPLDGALSLARDFAREIAHERD